MQHWLLFVVTHAGRGCWVRSMAFRTSALVARSAVRFLDKLLAMLERETRCIAALSRSMRLTQQHELRRVLPIARLPGRSIVITLKLEEETALSGKDKQALELAMNMLANDRQWGTALQDLRASGMPKIGVTYWGNGFSHRNPGRR